MTGAGTETGRAMAALFACLCAVQWPVAAFAPDTDAERGRALYEVRCNDCHDRSVHRRAPRAARTFAEIRSFVVRWDRELGALWRSDDVDAVTRYLNERFYGYPCPASVCGAGRADADSGAPRGSRPHLDRSALLTPARDRMTIHP